MTYTKKIGLSHLWWIGIQFRLTDSEIQTPRTDGAFAHHDITLFLWFKLLNNNSKWSWDMFYKENEKEIIKWNPHMASTFC